jgi:hypothetical protein
VFPGQPRVRACLRKVLARCFLGLVMLSYGEIVGEVDLGPSARSAIRKRRRASRGVRNDHGSNKT